MQTTPTRRGLFGRALLSFAVIFALASLPSYAQTDLGRVQGTVTDPAGAVVSGATITLTNTQTNVTRKVTLEINGSFTVDALPRGMYTAKVEQAGFATEEQNFELQVSATQTLNFELNPGAVATTVW